MSTEQTIEILRTLADRLEDVKDTFPEVSWWHALHEPLWNSNLKPTVNPNSIIFSIRVDQETIGLATEVRCIGKSIYADVVLPEISTISSKSLCVLKILGVDMTHIDNYHEKAQAVIQMLPEHLQEKAYEPIRKHRLACLERRKEAIAVLKDQIKELEDM